MIKYLIGFLLSIVVLFTANPAFTKDISDKSLNNLVDKVSAKFAKTFCNTSNFGISDQGAIEFAIGETNKEFAKNKLIGYIKSSDVNKKIASKIESNCQYYDFPLEELSNLDFNKN